MNESSEMEKLRLMTFSLAERDLKLRSDTATLNAFFSASYVGMAILSQERRFLKANAALALLLSRPLNELVGANSASVFPELNELFDRFLHGEDIIFERVRGRFTQRGDEDLFLVTIQSLSLENGDPAQAAYGVVVEDQTKTCERLRCPTRLKPESWRV